VKRSAEVAPTVASGSTAVPVWTMPLTPLPRDRISVLAGVVVLLVVDRVVRNPDPSLHQEEAVAAVAERDHATFLGVVVTPLRAAGANHHRHRGAAALQCGVAQSVLAHPHVVAVVHNVAARPLAAVDPESATPSVVEAVGAAHGPTLAPGVATVGVVPRHRIVGRVETVVEISVEASHGIVRGTGPDSLPAGSPIPIPFRLFVVRRSCIWQIATWRSVQCDNVVTNTR
jgi:hypothetical protein